MESRRVSILVATYNPNIDWLYEQLESLERQTYKNLKLYLLDDCSPDVDISTIEKALENCIKSFEYEIFENRENLGSCKTFEKLTDLADGDYFSYCDQDDIWESNKIETIMASISDANLAYTDLCIIDSKGKKTHDSLRDIRKRLVHRSGTGLFNTMLFRPFITGCTMIAKADIAKQSIPFVDEMIGDHHIALYAASRGRIEYIDIPLVRYRQHETNVTGIMKGVNSKRDYVNIRILPLITQFDKLLDIYYEDEFRKTIRRGKAWLVARKRYLKGRLYYGFIILLYSRYNFKTSIFDLAIPFMPKKVFEKAIETIRGQSS